MSTGNAAESAAERKHHPYSPSSLAYREACPAYSPKESTHERAIAGTRAHGVVETGDDDEKLSDKDAVAAADCLDLLDFRRKLLELEATAAFEAASAGGIRPVPELFRITELKEVYLKVDDEQFEDTDCTTGGFVDRVLLNYNKTYAEMLDWKFGYWEVSPAAENIQGIAYVLGLFRQYPTLQRIRFFFKQPHLDLLSDAVFERSQIPQLYNRVRAIVLRARESKRLGDFSLAQPFVPVCNFCAELGRCPTGLKAALHVSKKFFPVEFPDNITPGAVMDKSQTSLALRLAQVMKVWCDAFKRQVTDRIIRGEADIPAGYKLQTKQGTRGIVDAEKFKQVCLNYMTQAEYDSCLSASFGPLEDIVNDKAPRGQKENTIKLFQDELEAAGAVKKGAQFSFLRVEGGKKE